MLGLVVLSLRATAAEIRVSNHFDYHAIGEVAALFSGIFICMQIPIEILSVQGAELGLKSPVQFFWATGILSSFLDNAPTYVVFFEAARAMPFEAGAALVELAQNRTISEPLLSAISLGAVFMGAGSYIGNGPNFMVKSIAERQGVKMPSFFGYMMYAAVVLIPVFVAALARWTRFWWPTSARILCGVSRVRLRRTDLLGKRVCWVGMTGITRYPCTWRPRG